MEFSDWLSRKKKKFNANWVSGQGNNSWYNWPYTPRPDSGSWEQPTESLKVCWEQTALVWVPEPDNGLSVADGVHSEDGH